MQTISRQKFPFLYGAIIVKKLSISTKSNTKQILTKNNQFTAETQCPHLQVLTSCLCLGHTTVPQLSHRERVSFLYSIHFIMRLVLRVFGDSARTQGAGNPIRIPELLTLCFQLKRLRRIPTARFAKSKVSFFKNSFFDSLYSPAFQNKMYALFAVAAMICKKRSGHQTVFLQHENSCKFSSNMSTPSFLLL